MKNSLLPRRMTVIRLADEIVTVNQSQMEAGSKQIATLFADFRRSSIVFLTLAFVCATLLAVESIHRILGLERVSAQRLEEVEQARAASRELSARLINVQESERRALSRDLHDEVGQSLSALLLGIGNVAAALPPDSNPAIKDQLYDLRRLAERTVAVVRDMSLLLRPSMLDDLGLIPALQWQAREIFRTKNLHVLVDAEFVPEDLSDEQKTCIYRIVQEALNNAARHASARTVRVSLKRAADNLDLTIEDDGQGFMPEREKGLGLLGMEERVRHLGGALHIDSLPGRGTSIHVELPLLQTAAAHVV